MKTHLLHVFGIPALLAAISLIGLISALVADGAGDALSWLALGLLNAVIAWYWLKPAKR
jgi:hypothetical protein